MSVWKPKGSPFYQYDFQIGGRRFHGSTKCSSRREAEQVERSEREKAKQRATAALALSTDLSLDAVAGRYWTEHGRHQVGADSTWRDLERILTYFGRTKLLTEVTDSDVAQFIAWRRGHRVTSHAKKKDKAKEMPLISNATVNRSALEPLKKLFGRAKKSWGVKFENEPKWKDHRLKEPKERVRELHDHEAQRLDARMRDDFAPIFELARVTGFRLQSCFLKWADVDWSTKRITTKGKGGSTVTCAITPSIRAILWPLRGHDPEHVFTYVAQRTRGARIKGGNKVKGARYPMTYNGLKSNWRRLRKAAGLQDFRFHDFRHDVGTKLLRATGNLKLVQKALGHADIESTMRYAHVLDGEVADAIEIVAKSRKKSRTPKRKTA